MHLHVAFKQHESFRMIILKPERCVPSNFEWIENVRFPSKQHRTKLACFYSCEFF